MSATWEQRIAAWTDDVERAERYVNSMVNRVATAERDNTPWIATERTNLANAEQGLAAARATLAQALAARERGEDAPDWQYMDFSAAAAAAEAALAYRPTQDLGDPTIDFAGSDR